MEYEAGVKEALAEVQNKGLEDGNEHLVILRDGQVHWRADGTKTRVDYKAAEVKEGDVIVHNHPNSLNSLSNVDTLQVFTRGLKAVYAITADNSVYKASAVEATAPDRFMMDWDIASNEFASPQTMLSVANVPRETKARINEAHWVNRMLAAKGKFKYEFELGPETQRIVDEFDQRMHFDEVRDDYVNADFTPFIDLMNMLRGVGLVASILGAENAPTKPAARTTLGFHRDMSAMVFGEDSKATKWLDEKIAESPKGRDEEVIADESQILAVLFQLDQQGEE